MGCGRCIIVLLGIVYYSLSAPDPLNKININLNIGEGANAVIHKEMGKYGQQRYGQRITDQPQPQGRQQDSGFRKGGGTRCPMDQQLTKDCRCGSENCYAGESCAKFKIRHGSFGNFDRKCTTGCTNRCKQRGTICSDGYPIYCTCPDGTKEVDDPGMCPTNFRALDTCTCSDGKVIDKHPSGEIWMAPYVWLEPARGY